MHWTCILSSLKGAWVLSCPATGRLRPWPRGIRIAVRRAAWFFGCAGVCLGLLVWLLPFFWLVGLVFAFFAGVWLVCFCMCFFLSFWFCLSSTSSFRLSFLLCLSCWFSVVLGCSLACSVVLPLSLGFSCEIYLMNAKQRAV